MQIFISGTSTEVGKTIISSWLCLHTKAAYFKPIQTGTLISRDASTVFKLAKAKIYPELCSFPDPVAPNLAAYLTNTKIDLAKFTVPDHNKLIVEGAGGLMVPITQNFFIIDLIQQLKIPVILVINTMLGTINHTLLSLEALHNRKIPILGIIANGHLDQYYHYNKLSIEQYGNVKILAEFPYLNKLNKHNLAKIALPEQLQQALICLPKHLSTNTTNHQKT